MSESDKPSSRPRWYQFDLRLLLVVIAAVCVILALEVTRRPSSKVRGLRDIPQVGEAVLVTFEGHGPRVFLGGASNGTITEIGDDFLGVKMGDGGGEVFIPWNQIELIRRQLG